MKLKTESGIVLIAALMIMILLGALLTAFIISVNMDQGLIGVDRDQNRAFYASEAGLEKLTADLGTLFESNYAPTTAQINALTNVRPAITGISFTSPDGGSGYQIVFPTDAGGRPLATSCTVPGGPYEGLVGLITSYTMTSTARTTTNAEARLRRTLQTVAVPVFQFGTFSETDLSFFAGPNFNFGGRVHTNGNLFLAEGDGCTLTLTDRVTANGEVIRTHLNNGWATTNSYNGAISMIRAPGTYRSLARNEGSLVGTLGSALNDPTWTNLSIGTYNGNIRNGRTGARRMDLPLVSMEATPIDLIRRPAENSNEDTASPEIFNQRYFAMASLRILLSDTATHLTSLPSVTATNPLQLTGTAPTNGIYYAVAGTAANGYRSTAGTPLIDGYLKIEMQNQAGNWQDVTNEILSLGVAGLDMTTSGSICADQPNAILRFQRYKDSPTTTKKAGCTNSGINFWPNVLYDAREGDLRDNISTWQTTVYLGGVIHYVELDVANLTRWFTGAIGTNGANAMNTTGYVVYFSDRRSNRNAANAETGEYGFEDFVNPNSANGTPNALLDTGEDVNGNGALDVYGQDPTLNLPPGAANPLDSTARPWTATTAGIARVNRPLFFRRALMLVDGQTINVGASGGNPLGLTIASENPLYVKGNYNANGTFSGAHAPCAWIADAVTLLSNNWNDAVSFNSPHDPSGRAATTNWYRAAVVAGKGIPFPQPTGTEQDFGTDGGAHNFLRLLENWDGDTLNYRGSIVSLFYNRQAVGLYKCCTNVYTAPTRGFNFDVEFLTPSLLPPRTPMFRDINITGFSRLILPNQ
jgi:hypothetical protein